MPRSPRCAMALHHRSASFAMAVVLAATMLAGATDSTYLPAATEPAASCVPEEIDAAPARDPAEPVLVKYLSRRYLVATAATERMVGAAFQAAREVGLDPLVVLA